MKITKFGHSCMLVEEGGARILIDPGNYSTLQNSVRGIDAILITHEHPDHLGIESVKIINKNNPGVKIFTNSGAGKILTENGIAFELLQNGQKTVIKSISIEAFGKEHVIWYKGMGSLLDTGYMIAEKFFYPGDAWHVPDKPVKILALSVVGSWMKLSEAMDYALKVKPQIAFPVHDGVLKIAAPFYKNSEKVLSKNGIEFKILEEGKEYEF